MATSNRWLVIVGGVVALAVIAGIAVTVLASGERIYPEGSPERVVQDYLRAVNDRDATAAFGYLAPDLAAKCEPKPRDAISNRGSTSIRATLDRSEVRDSTAEVRVNLTETYGGGAPFGGGESTYTQTFVLKQIDGNWRFSEAPWPIYCPEPLR